MERLKNMLSIRGDSLYCPLSFSLDSYGNCLVDCWHCYLRRLNRTWGKALKPVDLEELRRKLVNGLKAPDPKTPLAWALKHKKTVRFGNKTDPFQPVEREWRVSREVLRILIELKWSAVIQTHCTDVMWEYEDLLFEGKDLFTIMPVISPGLEKDWELFERARTTKPLDRLRCAGFFASKGFNVGVNGEPFIPGFHTEEDFERTLKLLRKYGIRSYNTYNLHWNDFIEGRLFETVLSAKEMDKIWLFNANDQWKAILPKLIDLAKRYDIDLGCPDFVYSGTFVQRANTCCGVEVPRPCTFNVIHWKKRLAAARSRPDKMLKVLEETWDGVGDYELGRKVMTGEVQELFTVKDINKGKDGLLF